MKKLRTVLRNLGALGTRVLRLPWRALLPDAADVHVYPGLLLLGWGLWRSPVSWLAFVVVGLALWYMGAVHPILAARIRHGPVPKA